MNIVILDSKHWPDLQDRGITKQDIQEVVETAVKEVAESRLPLPDYVNVVVYPAEAGDVIPETGVMGMTYSDEYVSVYFDHTLPYGKKKLYEALRATVFHELVHATTFQYEPWQPGVLFGAVTEGLATVFERDHADARPLWADYEGRLVMRDWLDELKALPDETEKNRDYFFQHPDGRRWIVYKTGVWIIDTLLSSGGTSLN